MNIKIEGKTKNNTEIVKIAECNGDVFAELDQNGIILTIFDQKNNEFLEFEVDNDAEHVLYTVGKNLRGTNE